MHHHQATGCVLAAWDGGAPWRSSLFNGDLALFWFLSRAAPPIATANSTNVVGSGTGS